MLLQTFTFFHLLASFQEIRRWCVSISGAETFVGLKPVFKNHAPLLLTLPPTPFGCCRMSLSLSLFLNYSPFKSEAMSTSTSARSLQGLYVLWADDAAILILSLQGCMWRKKRLARERVKKLVEPLRFPLTQCGTELIKHQLCFVSFYIATPTSLLDRGPAPCGISLVPLSLRL